MPASGDSAPEAPPDVPVIATPSRFRRGAHRRICEAFRLPLATRFAEKAQTG
jgi:hypothetical protein